MSTYEVRRAELEGNGFLPLVDESATNKRTHYFIHPEHQLAATIVIDEVFGARVRMWKPILEELFALSVFELRLHCSQAVAVATARGRLRRLGLLAPLFEDKERKGERPME